MLLSYYLVLYFYSRFLELVYSSGWHYADEIIDGIFSGNYIFSGTVDFTNATFNWYLMVVELFMLMEVFI